MNFFRDLIAVHANLAARHLTYGNDDGSQNRNLWNSSLAIEGDPIHNLTVATEVGISRKEYDRDRHNPSFIMLGGRYAVTNEISLSAGIRTGLTTSDDDYRLLYGIIMRF